MFPALCVFFIYFRLAGHLPPPFNRWASAQKTEISPRVPWWKKKRRGREKKKERKLFPFLFRCDLVAATIIHTRYLLAVLSPCFVRAQSVRRTPLRGSRQRTVVYIIDIQMPFLICRHQTRKFLLFVRCAPLRFWWMARPFFLSRQWIHIYTKGQHSRGPLRDGPANIKKNRRRAPWNENIKWEIKYKINGGDAEEDDGSFVKRARSRILAPLPVVIHEPPSRQAAKDREGTSYLKNR